MSSEIGSAVRFNEDCDFLSSEGGTVSVSAGYVAEVIGSDPFFDQRVLMVRLPDGSAGAVLPSQVSPARSRG